MRTLTICSAVLATLGGPLAWGAVPITDTFSDGTDSDQDDMAVWVHPTDASLTTIIGSDKGNGKVYVYDLDGAVIQTIQAGKPGNIDVRYGVRSGSDCIDVVAFNDRTDATIRVYRVDPTTRQLTRIDDGGIDTGDNYGFTLYKHNDGALYAYTGPKSSSRIRQYALVLDDSGVVSGVATDWEFQSGTIEGMVADDEAGYVFLSEEAEGIWRIDAMDATDRELIATVGDASGLAADVEGITIYHAGVADGYLIASSQGQDKFTVLDRRPPHEPRGEFQIAQVGSTDGVDVLNMALDETYSQGVFLVHNGADCCAIQSVKWELIASEAGGLVVDTDSWDPRDNCADPDDGNGDSPDAGGGDGPDGGDGDNPGDPGDDGAGESGLASSGCGCSAGPVGRDSRSGSWLLVLVVAAWRRRGVRARS